MIQSLRYLHVLAGFVAFMLFVGPEVVLQALLRRGDVRAIRAVARIQQRLDPWAIGAFVGAVTLGFGTAIAEGVPLSRPWLILGLGLAAAITVLGLFVYTPKARALLDAAEHSDDGEPSPDLTFQLRRPVHLAALVASAVLWPALIFVMVAKPYG